jgi:hypothetical protein
MGNHLAHAFASVMQFIAVMHCIIAVLHCIIISIRRLDYPDCVAVDYRIFHARSFNSWAHDSLFFKILFINLDFRSRLQEQCIMCDRVNIYGGNRGTYLIAHRTMGDLVSHNAYT